MKGTMTMAEKFRYVCVKPARLLYSNVAVKSAPRGVTNAEPKFSGTFGLEKEDFDAIVKLEVDAIKSETGSFTNPGDYYLACTSGETAAKRVLAKAALDAQGKSADEALKINERAEQRAALYRQYAGIMTAASKYDVECAKLENGKIVDLDISTDANRAMVQRDFMYGGAYVVPAVAFQGYRRKTLDAKDGVTAFLQNVLFVRKGDKIGGLAPSNKEVFGGFSDYDPTGGGAFADDLDDDVAF
jgi:hypothetical protein